MRLGERIAAARPVLEHEFDAAPGHDLEARHVVAGAFLGDAEQFEAGFHRADADKGGLHRAWPRDEAEHCGGDDAERAFGTDEQVFQVVAGIVLFQLIEMSSTRPSASTTSRPSACERAMP